MLCLRDPGGDGSMMCVWGWGGEYPVGLCLRDPGGDGSMMCVCWGGGEYPVGLCLRDPGGDGSMMCVEGGGVSCRVVFERSWWRWQHDVKTYWR